MAKRASLSFDALKESKAAPASGEGEAGRPAVVPAQPPPAVKRGRGRPAKRAPGLKTFGMTLRVSGPLRLALRRAAEKETDARGEVVSVHDVIVEAVTAHLARKGVKIEG